MNLRPAIFIDRDGVINEKASQHDYIKDWSEFRFLPNSIKGLQILSNLGLPLFVVTNQRGIARKLMSIDTLNEIHKKMGQRIRETGAVIDEVYYCPHDIGEKCDCRKPRPGMLLRAAKEHSIDLTRSFMVDDSKSGIEAGAKAGCQTIFISGDSVGSAETQTWECRPSHVCRDLKAAAELIAATFHSASQRTNE